jgi:hypothetical protein
MLSSGMPKDDTKGFSPDEVDYLTHHAREIYGPDDFDEEVQRHIDKWSTPQDTFGQKEISQDESISNVASGNPAVIPSQKTGLPAKTPPWDDLGN